MGDYTRLVAKGFRSLWRLSWAMRLSVFGLLLLAGCGGGDNGSAAPGQVHFVPNSHAFWSNPKNWTTTYGPAYADITLASTNSSRAAVVRMRCATTLGRADLLRTSAAR